MTQRPRPRPAQLGEPEIDASIERDRPDTRDLMFEPANHGVPPPDAVEYTQYQRLVATTWHQRGEECTGFALAAIANYTIRRVLDDAAIASVSRRMLYEVAQVHDGEEFTEGSTLRGALKGWRLTGVASDEVWPYDPDDEHGQRHGALTLSRVLDARHRPLFAYRRVRHDDIDVLKAAVAEGHALFASARVHVGWYRLFLPHVEPHIERLPDDDDKGGHAFVIAGYDEDGLWVHNSWGPEWGVDGYARLPYDDWLAHGLDVWVIDVPADTVGAPARLPSEQPAVSAAETAAYRDMWPHLVVLRDDGQLASDGLYEMDHGSLRTMLFLFQEWTAEWPQRRLAVICDNGYDPIVDTIERYRAVRDRSLASGVYPIFVLWETSWWTEFVAELTAWLGRLEEIDHQQPLALDDAVLDRVVERSALRTIWSEVLRRAERAGGVGGGARLLTEVIAKKRAQIAFDLHLVSHGPGDLVQAGIARRLPAPITSASAVASATSVHQAQRSYLPLLDRGHLDRLTVLSLDADAEAGDRVGPLTGSPLLAIDSLLAPNADAHGGRFGVIDADPRPWERHRRDGRFERVALAAPRHLDLAGSVDLHERLIAAMLSTRSVAPGRGAQHLDDHGHPPVASAPMDPLAAAIRRASRR